MELKSVTIVKIDDAEFHFREPRLDETLDPDNALDEKKLKSKDSREVAKAIGQTFKRLVKVVNVKIDGEELTPEGARELKIPQALAIKIINELFKTKGDTEAEAAAKN